MFSKRPRLNGALAGCAVTVLCTVVFFALQPLLVMEYWAFDWRVRNCNTLEPTPPIVHVDIDDGALERVGRWPWRRDQLADVIRVLHELNARVIAVDLLLSEPEPPLIDDPRYGRDADVEPNVVMVGNLSKEDVVLGDLELADAIRNAGNVFLPIQLSLGQPQSVLPDASSSLRVVKVGARSLQERARGVLLADFTATAEDIAAALQTNPGEVEAFIAGVKSEAANELTARLFEGGAAPALEEVLGAILGDQKDRRNADREDVLAAYRRQLGLAAAKKRMHRLEAASAVVRATDAEPPLFLLGQAAHDIVAVNFTTDVPSGIVRRVPVIIDYHGRAVKHMGFAVACELLGLDADRITISADRVLSVPVKGEGGGELRAPLDADGNLVINWTRTATEWRQAKDFPHISAAKVWTIADARRQMRDNEIALAYAHDRIVSTAKGDIVIQGEGSGPVSAPGDEGYRQNVRRFLEARRALHLAELHGRLSAGELGAKRRELAALKLGIEQEQQQAAAFVRQAIRDMADVSEEELKADPRLSAEAERFRGAQRLLDEDIARLLAANAALGKTVEAAKGELRERIGGKYVFLGFAATAAGDIVSTPIDPRTNGVMCHAAVLNSFLQRRFISTTPPWLGAVVCLALGAVAAVVTATRGPRVALAITLALIAGYVAFNAYIVFLRWGEWLALAAAVATTAVTWAVVTLLRQLTAEREKRLFAKQLSQYTSPAIAARIAESPDAAAAFKTVQTRDMTCFFSDLQGFTTISEQEDPEVVQLVLNTYLDRMSRAIWSQRGLVNKFMGDGVMAFFNSSVDPLEEHARSACETSLLVLDELERLKAEQADGPAGRIFARLNMRTGLASGLCKNGDLGSELKADYTVIGDVVNLAARLEPANKVFGTRIMVSGGTRDAVNDLYEFRYLAELQVKGKAKTAPVYELLGRRGTLTGEQRAYLERFEAGVRLYQQRKWDECIVHFTRLLARRVDDLGASRYLDACQEMKAFPPGEAWGGALELKEK